MLNLAGKVLSRAPETQDFISGKKEANYGSTQNRKEYGSDEQQ